MLSCQSKSSLSALVQCFWWRDGGFCSCTLAWGWCEETPKTCVPGSAVWGESFVFLGPDNEVRTLAPLVTMSCSLLPQQVLWLLCFFTCQNLAGEQGWVLSSIPQLFSVREFPDDSHFIRESNSVWEVEWKCLKIASAVQFYLSRDSSGIFPALWSSSFLYKERKPIGCMWAENNPVLFWISCTALL